VGKLPGVILFLRGDVMPKISVVMPVYKAESSLRDSLKSVLFQSLNDIELIAVNDGSPDGCGAILLDIAQAEPRLRVISQENQGVFAARNAAIREAQGEFIAFLDPDDEYPDETVLEDLYSAARSNAVKICGGSWSKLAGRTLVTQFAGHNAKFTFHRDEMLSYRDYQFDFGYQRFIFSREFLQENGLFFPPYLRYQDPPFFVRAMLAAQNFFALRRITYRYRWGHQNIRWDLPHTLALLDGLSEVLMLANSNNLEALHRLTLWRIMQEVPRTLEANLTSQNPQVLERLLKIERMIRHEYCLGEETPSVAPMISGILRLREKEAARLERVRGSMLYRAEELLRAAAKRGTHSLRRNLPYNIKAKMLRRFPHLAENKLSALYPPG
jgi:glycosyltransferase involved in cell wall biosynthesis